MTTPRKKNDYSMEDIQEICKPYLNINGRTATIIIDAKLRNQFENQMFITPAKDILLRRILMGFKASGYATLEEYINQKDFADFLNHRYPDTTLMVEEKSQAAIPAPKPSPLESAWDQVTPRITDMFDDFFSGRSTKKRTP
ncbi:MAG: hypothetical protein ACYCQI_01555 [Gammaproteobacteria bacterium]